VLSVPYLYRHCGIESSLKTRGYEHNSFNLYYQRELDLACEG